MFCRQGLALIGNVRGDVRRQWQMNAAECG